MADRPRWSDAVPDEENGMAIAQQLYSELDERLDLAKAQNLEKEGCGTADLLMFARYLHHHGFIREGASGVNIRTYTRDTEADPR
jgi:hypothetical protein